MFSLVRAVRVPSRCGTHCINLRISRSTAERDIVCEEINSVLAKEGFSAKTELISLANFFYENRKFIHKKY